MISLTAERRARTIAKRQQELLIDHDTAFKQQRLKVQKFNLTPRSVMSTLLIVSLWCGIMGVALMQSQGEVVEISHR